VQSAMAARPVGRGVPGPARGRQRGRGASAARAIAALAVLALGGCAAPRVVAGTWTRPDATRTQQLRDEYECERRAVLGQQPGGLPVDRVYEECMLARGYERVR
jgi:hypothetical protein